MTHAEFRIISNVLFYSKMNKSMRFCIDFHTVEPRLFRVKFS